MAPEDPFRRAIRDNPDDDAPRLVFADWLEEHGEAERGEFIRVQCELARPETPPARRKRLATRERTRSRGTYTLRVGRDHVIIRIVIDDQPPEEGFTFPVVRYQGTIRGTLLNVKGRHLRRGNMPFWEEYHWVALPRGR